MRATGPTTLRRTLFATLSPSARFSDLVSLGMLPARSGTLVKNGTVYAFGRGVPLQSITDRYHNQVTIVRNANLSPTCSNPGTLIASYINGTSTGRYVDLCYDDTHNTAGISKAVDNSGPAVNYTYDTSKRLTKVTYTSYNANASTSYYFGTGAHLGDVNQITTQVSSTSTDTVFVSYDTSNRLNQLSNVYNFTPALSYTYTTTGSPAHISQVTVTLPGGSLQPGALSKRTLNFDAAGYLTSDTRGIKSGSTSETTTYTRGGTNRYGAATELVTQITDSLTPTARTTSFTYDGNNSNITYGDVTNVAFTALLAGSQQTATTSYGYGNYHEVNSITDPLNHTSNITIDRRECYRFR